MNVWHSICKFVLTNPSVAIFLTLGLGYLLGRFHIKSFKLGATVGVLLVGLVIGQMGKFQIAPVVKNLFFDLFIFTIGYEVGPVFINSFKKKGIKFIIQRQYSEHWNDIFKTITTNNGSEFADLSNLEDVSNTLVYYAHPYASCDKGTVERHNGLIRRFIPKGEAIANYSLQDIINIETWCNSLPRKILAYHTPDEIFERELDLIYQAA